jgi:hypothetical protein
MSTILQKYFRGGGGAVAAMARANGAIDASRRRGKSSAAKMKARFSRKKMQFAFTHRRVHASRRGTRDFLEGHLDGA